MDVAFSKLVGCLSINTPAGTYGGIRPPESCVGNFVGSPSADIFCFRIVVYEILRGRKSSAGETVEGGMNTLSSLPFQ